MTQVKPLIQLSPTYEDITAAAERLRGVAHRTPVLTSRLINEKVDCQVFFKAENFQKTGSFKFRGAYNALSQFSESQKQGGVITYSSGNHAQAIAHAGRLLGIKTTIVMPKDAPRVKIEATQGYGAEVILYNRAEAVREELAHRIAQERGMMVIPPYNYEPVIAGQGTTAQELLEEVGDLDYLLVCCGGGGLLSGCAIAAKTLSPHCRIIGVEPRAGDDATRSFYTKTLQRVENPDTIADGARTPCLGSLTFPLILHYVDDMVTVKDEAIVTTMFYLWERLKVIIEPTGALAATALLQGKFTPPVGSKVGVVITGGNVELDQVLRC
ncbi:threo-3-hydroxy-L-aspartate ammonia-lyase [Spirulina subsalsa FACHB-351]|uniref:Threo-3-hydroxy-L-aspartate ammonia-lyase n=1 Tax=Spirulina subsalsa FACHB-351 TaxID=234711 RepID=A0ABT3L171_9CYAN|nr:threo-3-hydroxy-L-aspartate ammonia-lyase [Spirulina subsalsa]MCW6035249.1 threo-3-hydroxy-L-aspartate ammonia-lyase [Spirulina subsalsa FACHB-351]